MEKANNEQTLENEKKRADELNQQATDQLAVSRAEAQTYAEEAYRISKIASYKTGLAKSLLTIGICKFHFSNFQEAVEALNESSIYCDECNLDQTETLFWLSRAHDRIGNYSLALELSFKLLKSLEGGENQKALAQAYGQIGTIHLHLNEFEKAIEYFLKTLDLVEKQNDKHSLASVYNNLGVIFRKNQSYDEALMYLEKSLAIAQSLNKPDSVAYPLYHIANVYHLQGNRKEAEATYRRGLELCKDGTDKYILSSHLLGLADIAIEQKDLTGAMRYYRQVLKYAEASQSKEILLLTHERLYDCYKKKRNLSKALFHLEQYHEVRQAMYSEASEKKIRELQTALDYNTAQKEAEIYRLRNIELASANEALLLANQVKNEFLAIATHDLKNPLQTIMGFAEVIREKPFNAELVSRQAQSIYNASQRMLRLVNDLLKVAQIESGHFELRLAETDVGGLVRLACDELEHRAKHKEIELNLQIENNCVASVDAARLFDAIQNLIENAVKYSSKGKKIYITVATVTTPHDNLEISAVSKVIRVSVSDEGLGFTAEDKMKMFGKFQRLSARPTGNETSTGLGLSIVKQIVELHGGKISAFSDGLNKGATFEIEIPVKAVSER